MCWSAEVSKAFACLDLVFVGILLCKKYYCYNSSTTTATTTSSNNNRATTFYGTYAAALSAVTLQEWAQYAIWESGRLKQGEEEVNVDVKSSSSSSCTGRDMFFSLLASGSAAAIPLILIIAATVTKYYYHYYSNPSFSPLALSSNTTTTTTTTSTNRNKAWNECTRESDRDVSYYDDASTGYIRKASALWSTMMIIEVYCVVHTGTYCIELGKNHHQVWICASAIYQTGGFPLYFLVLLLYLLSALLASLALPLPPSERHWNYGIALANAVVAYGLYSWTLEACSIWCWSAFSYGIYFSFLCFTQ